MRLAIDARELTGHPTGVGRYLSELLVEWQAAGLDRRHELRLYAHARPVALAPDLVADIRVVPGAGATRWEQWDFARALGRERPDVVFAPGYTAPLAAPAPTVVAIHDVSFFAHPEWFTWREGMRRRLLTAWSARRARLVLTPSAFSAAEIIQHTALDRSRIRLVYPGVRPAADPGASARAPVVLFVGSLFQRRRIDVLVDAFARVAAERPDARLEIVGRQPHRADRSISPPPSRGGASQGERACATGSTTPHWPISTGRRRCSCSSPATRASASRPSKRWPMDSYRSCSTRRWRAKSTATPPGAWPKGRR